MKHFTVKYLCCFILIFLAAEASGQQLTGIWQGRLTQGPGGCFPEYNIELQIQSNNKEINGTSYDYYDTSLFVKLNFTGGFVGNKKTILLTEKVVVQEKIPEDCAPCLKTYNLSYSKQNDEEMLTGKWAGEETGNVAGCPPGFISLRKVKKSAFVERKRETEVVQVFVVDSANVQVDLLDNGVVDGDSVSVIFDNHSVVYKKGLSLTPVTFNYTLQPSREYEMVILSESMGTISPTTALVVITSAGKQYQVFISSDEKKSSAVKIIYKKKGVL